MLEIFAILIVALAAFLHYRAGIWGAVLTVFAVLVAGAAAFGFYLPASAAIGSTGVGAIRFWGDALMFLAIFLASFTVLRLVAEQLLKNVMGFLPLVNSIGGAAIGLVAGYLVAGIFTVFVQMLPLPPTVFGYEPFKLGSTQRVGHLSLKYDENLVGLYGGLSRKALQNGDAAGLAARYPAQDLAAAPDPSRGATTDDILYHYFCRRVDFALRNADSPLIYGEGEHKGTGVRLVNPNGSFGAGNASADIRNGLATTTKVKNAWTSPILDWTGPDGKRSVITPSQLKWAQADGSEREADRDEVFLVVQVSFRSQVKDAVTTINLNDWFLDSVFTQESAQSRSRREPLEIHFPKLLARAEAKSVAPGQPPVVTMTSIPAVPAKGKEPAVWFLDNTTVHLDKLFFGGKDEPAWNPSLGLKPAAKDDKPNALILASEAAWNFDPEVKSSADAEATLVFLVPSLSRPFQYGLKCFQKPAVVTPGVHLESGLLPGVRQKLPGFNITTLAEVERHPSLPELGRKAKPDHEFMIVKVSISRSDTGPAVMNQKDLLLTYESPKEKKEKEYAEFPVLLRVEYVTKNGKTERQGRFSNAEIQTGSPLMLQAPKVETAVPASAVSAAGAAKAEGSEVEVFSDWEIFFKAKSASCDLTLIFEVPHGKPPTQYKFKLPDEFPSAAPDWYQRKYPKRAGASVNNLVLKSFDVVPTLPLISANGKVTSYTVGEESGAEMAVLTLALSPKKDDDLTYYQLKVSDFTAQLKMKNLTKGVALFALRLPNEQNFRLRLSLKDDDIVTLHGPTELALAIYAVKGYSEIQLRVTGFSPFPIPNPAAPVEQAPVSSAAPVKVPVPIGPTGSHRVRH